MKASQYPPRGLALALVGGDEIELERPEDALLGGAGQAVATGVDAPVGIPVEGELLSPPAEPDVVLLGPRPTEQSLSASRPRFGE